MAVVIKNGTIVTACDTFVADICIECEKIVEIDKTQSVIPSSSDTVIYAKGKYVIPGGVDVHTHLDLDTGFTKTADDFITGTKAAIAGGTTTIIDFATQDKGGTLKHAVKAWHKKAEKAFCDYGFHMAIVDWNDDVADEMTEVAELGITSFKLYMAYKSSLQVDDDVIYKALKKAKEVGGLIGFHCENGDLVDVMSKELIAQGKTSPFYHPLSRPDCVEEEAVFRLCKIAHLADAPIWVVHLSTSKGLKIIHDQKKRGLHIVTETCPQYLLLDERNYGVADGNDFNGAKYVISPPLRKNDDIEALWCGLRSGAIDFVSTDHCSFNYKGQKEFGINDFTKIPNGGPGVEHRVILLYNFGVVKKQFTINKFVELIAEAPAKMFGLSNKGKIEVGRDADLVILNPDAKTIISAATQMQNVDYTPYEGYELDGGIESVFLRGQLVFNDQFLAKAPCGRFQKRIKGFF